MNLSQIPQQILVPLAVICLLVAVTVTGRRGLHDTSDRPTIVYAHPPCPPDLMIRFEEAFEDFRTKHPEIAFHVLHITGNYEDKVKIMFAGKVAPDVIFMYPTAVSAWVELDALEPLDDFIVADSSIKHDDYFRAGLDTFSLRGNLYGLPKDASADLLFYNKRMFREQGVSLPNDDWTWQDILDAAKRLSRDTDGDGRIDVFGLLQPQWDQMIIQNGGRIISADGSRCLLDEPAAIEALRKWSAYRTVHRVTPTPEATMDTSSWRLFALERLGMFLSMYPAVPILRRTCDFEWDIALPPSGPVRRYSAFVGSALAVTSQSRHKEAAYLFARWMTSEGMRHVMSFDIPAYRPLGESDVWRDRGLPPPSKHVAIQVMEFAGEPAINHPDWNEIYDAINPGLDRVNRGVVTVEEAVSDIVPKVNAILNRRNLENR